jgi:hypothetical protein
VSDVLGVSEVGVDEAAEDAAANAMTMPPLPWRGNLEDSDAEVNAPYTLGEDVFFKCMAAAARSGYGADIAPAGDACTSARAEEELWDGIARAAFGEGRRTRLMAAAAPPTRNWPNCALISDAIRAAPKPA